MVTKSSGRPRLFPYNDAVAADLGLRERKKRQTRQLIFDAAHRLFAERGFDGVTVAEIARAADVSEVTVFNYFPSKEDLFYGGMQFFEEQLVDALRGRARGESALAAFRRRVLEGADGLATKQRVDAIRKAAQAISVSPTLVARERDIVDSYTRQLAVVLAEEAGAAPDDVEPLAAAGALMVVHRMLVDHVRRQVLAGRRGPRLAEDFKSQARRAFRRLEHGLGDYAIKTR
jgi:AcrR family transcriptional regulator